MVVWPFAGHEAVAFAGQLERVHLDHHRQRDDHEQGAEQEQLGACQPVTLGYGREKKWLVTWPRVACACSQRSRTRSAAGTAVVSG